MLLRERVAPHRLRGGALPEPRRVLHPRHRHLHAARATAARVAAATARWARRSRCRPTPASPSAWREAAARLRLRYVVLTAVARDDLADGGAAHFAATVAAVRRALPAGRVEVLTPDFKGERAAPRHGARRPSPTSSTTTSRRCRACSGSLRPQGRYARSLDVLEAARAIRPGELTKSGLMVGPGRDRRRGRWRCSRDLRATRRRHRDARPVPAADARARAGRPLRPARGVRAGCEREARALGFPTVYSGVFVRSSLQRRRGRSTSAERALTGDGLRREGLAALSGVLLVLSFPKFGHGGRGLGRARAAAGRAPRRARACARRASAT